MKTAITAVMSSAAQANDEAQMLRSIYDRFYRARSKNRIDWLTLVDEISASSSFQQAIMEHSPRAIAAPKAAINLPFAS